MHRIRLAAGVAVVTTASLATGQPATSIAKSPAGSGASLPYASAFADYRPFQDTDVGDWKALNEQVRQAAEKRAMPAPPAATSKPAVPMPTHPMPHGGGK